MQQNQAFIQEIEAPTESFPYRKFIIQKEISQEQQKNIFFVKSKNWGILDQNDFALNQTFLNNVGESEIKLIEQTIEYQNSQFEVTHPTNIIKIFDNFIFKNQYNITIMEKGDIDLYEFLNQNRDKLSQEEKLQICIDTTRPIYYLHQKKLLHRDIKPENYIKVGNVFKLIDFGFVRKSTYSKFKTFGIGTPIFQAPELVENKENYSDKVDVWALACVFYEIFNKKALFDYTDPIIIKQKILNHIDDQSEVNQKISSLFCNLELQNLLKAMLNPKEELRLDSKEVLERLIKLKNQPKQINPFSFYNQVNFQQEQKRNFSQSQQIAFQEQQIGGRISFQLKNNLNPQQFKQIEQKQFQNQFQNQIEENQKKYQEFQTIKEVNNTQFQINMNKLNDQYSDIETLIIKIVNEKIEQNNRQIQQQEQNILLMIQQQNNKEFEQLKLENNNRDQDIQTILSQFQNELNNKQLIVKQQQESNQQNMSIETQKILDNFAEIKKSQDTKIQQLESAQNQIQLQFNQIFSNQATQINNQMTSILEQYRKSQLQEVEAINQRINRINENFVKLKNEMELKISQYAEQTQQDINQTAAQAHNNLNQYKENSFNNFEQLKKEFRQELFKIMITDDQKFYQFKQDIERLSKILDQQKQILQTQVENNKIFNPLQIDNLQNATQSQKDVYMNYNQILEKLRKTHSEILFLNQQIIGLEQFIYK